MANYIKQITKKVNMKEQKTLPPNTLDQVTPGGRPDRSSPAAARIAARPSDVHLAPAPDTRGFPVGHLKELLLANAKLSTL